MKRIKPFGIFAAVLLLLLTGCSMEALMERGANMLDKALSDSIDPIASSAPKADAEPPKTPEPDPTPTPKPANDAAEEPDIPELIEPIVPDDSDDQLPSEPIPSQEKPEPSSEMPELLETVTPSHTDATLFAPGESFLYLPKGITGTYACDYTSENDTIASVNSSTGRVTAVGIGTTKIKMHVEYNGRYDFECIVRCNWKNEEKKSNPSNKDSGASNKDDPEPILPPTPSTPDSPPASPSSDSEPSASASPSDGTITASHTDATFFNPKEHFRLLPVGAGDDYTISYTTSNASVASVDEKTGVVTAVGPGTSTITMSVDCGGNEYIFECIVRCKW